MSRRVRMMLAALVLFAGLPAKASAQQPRYQIVREGPLYIPMPDGVELAATLFRPDAPGPYPVIVAFAPYGYGESANPIPDPELVRRGFANLTVSMRGSGCSSGSFRHVDPQMFRDGYTVVEWAAAQPWSTGKIGMHGYSYPGIVSLFVAGYAPPHLTTIVPAMFYDDAYRVVYPGGIYNYALWSIWSAAYPASTMDGSLNWWQYYGSEAGRRCLEHQTGYNRYDPVYHLGLQTATHPLNGEFWSDLSPVNYVRGSTIPTLMIKQWQDEWLNSRGVEVFEALRGPKQLLATNGGHQNMSAIQPMLERVYDWFEYWLKGVDNGVMNEAPVTAFFETDHGTGTEIYRLGEPNFVRTYTSWPPVETEYVAFHLREGGRLSEAAPDGAEEPDAYVYPVAQEGYVSATYGGLHDVDNSTFSRPRAGGLSYESEPFASDRLLLGHVGVNLYASSTALDTDLFVVLSEVDSDGNATFLQKGALRASHRALDPARSTPQRPYHPHTDAQMLTPGQVYRFDVEINAVGHPIRQGSKVRIDIVAPPLEPALNWTLAPTLQPGVNMVFHDADHRSVLWLPFAPAGGTLPAPRACGTLLNQPCRPAPVP